ncbi:MAG: gephyrin-like molybdotransferase Glp [Betaproteobacteria bacterium]
MKTAQEALQALLAVASAVSEVELVLVQDALGRVLAQDVISQVNVPPMDNSQMDGYGVNVKDVKDVGIELNVSQRIPAGYVGKTLAPGTAVRIFTGASIPEGVNAVIMQESCVAIGEIPEAGIDYRIQINQLPQAGEWIRSKGEDIAEHGIVLKAGTFLRPQELGLAASIGLTHLSVKRRLRVATFFTGDELTLPGETLKPGGIYNSNRDTLLACIKTLGCIATDLGIVPDTLDATRATLREAAQHHDLIVTSGGVSVGEEDHIKPAVMAEGRLDMWQIAIKPGKPLAFGAIRRSSNAEKGEAWFMGLPGNPVSSFITFLLFVKPFIACLQGRTLRKEASYLIPANFQWEKPDRRNEFLRVRMNEQGQLELFPNQSSGVLTSASWGDGIIDNPANQIIHRGDLVKFIPFSQLLN